MVAPKTEKKQQVKAEPKANGRPTIYSKDLSYELCSLLSEGMSLRKITENYPNMPSKSTVFRWIDCIEGFRDQYEKAKEEGADSLADEIIDIADEEPYIEEKVGDKIVRKLDSAGIARNRLRTDARKWVAAKLKPKKYGDKATMEHTGKDGDAILVDHVNVAMEELFETIKNKL